ncbi:hypothetical protein EVAR_39961_1 [Eumeta japonica]|uniref:Uncharacterized protein n=1 Tax=Eumeta variegata TaxID=151549 RepID=A0A4C1X2W4_EUMVA|nr:hypothetical protein EVAR_39961_1 [Eumeta japonica]
MASGLNVSLTSLSVQFETGKRSENKVESAGHCTNGFARERPFGPVADVSRMETGRSRMTRDECQFINYGQRRGLLASLSSGAHPFVGHDAR